MEQAFITASIWIGLAILATFAASRLRVSIALMEIIVGVLAAFVLTRIIGADATGSKAPWLVFVANTGAILLTFLAGAELEPSIMRAKWKEVSVVGYAVMFEAATTLFATRGAGPV